MIFKFLDSTEEKITKKPSYTFEKNEKGHNSLQLSTPTSLCNALRKHKEL